MIPKFRFWYEREDFYPDENYMRDVWAIEYITDSKIKLNDDYLFDPYTNVAENIYAKTKVYLMQSTGLKDKNGVEIYEYSELDGAYEVIFKDLRYSLRHIQNNDIIDLHDYWRGKNGEIEVTREYTKV